MTSSRSHDFFLDTSVCYFICTMHDTGQNVRKAAHFYLFPVIKYINFHSIHYLIKLVNDFVAGRCFSPGTPVFFTNKTDCHDITKIMLRVALNSLTLTLTIHFIFRDIFVVYLICTVSR